MFSLFLNIFTYSKRTSGFDMAPPASAMLAGASAVTGTCTSTHVYITNIFNLNCFLSFFGPSMENSYQIAWCNLVSQVQSLSEYITFTTGFHGV